MLRLRYVLGRAVALLFSGAIVAFTVPAQSATLEAYLTGTQQEVVVLAGEIVGGDAVRLMELVEASVQAQRPLPSLSLNSGGGLFLEGIRLAQIVKRFGLATYVEEGAYCASACFLVFAAGKEKFASYSGRIGVHAAKHATGDAVSAAAGTQAMGLLLKRLGVSDAITQKMADTPHERVAWLSTPELQSIGVKPLSFSDAAPLDRALGAVAERGPHPLLPDAEKVWLWDRLVRAASRLSIRQNSGRAQVMNVCTSQMQTCTSSVSFRSRSGTEMVLRTTRDRSGKVTARDLCEQGVNADAQICRPWARPK
jgi:hypothetical protein